MTSEKANEDLQTRLGRYLGEYLGKQVADRITQDYDLVPRPKIPDLTRALDTDELGDLYLWLNEALCDLHTGAALPKQWVFDTPEDIVKLMWALKYARVVVSHRYGNAPR